VLGRTRATTGFGWKYLFINGNTGTWFVASYANGNKTIPDIRQQCKRLGLRWTDLLDRKLKGINLRILRNRFLASVCVKN